MIHLDFNLTLIDDQLAARRPERGGLLLATASSAVFDEVILDRPERAPGPVWSIDEEIARDLAEREIARPELRWVGTIHSHPGGFDRPSGQDVIAAVDMLRRNPIMGRAHLHIVTRWRDLPPGAADAVRDHELPLEHGKVSCFVVHAPRGTEAAVAVPEPVTVLPIFEHMTALAHALDGRVTGLSTTAVAGVSWSIGTAETGHGRIRAWAPAGYPAAAPFVTFDGGSGEAVVPIRWDPGTRGAERLVEAVVPALDAGVTSQEAAGSLTDRVAAPLGGSIDACRVTVFGLGSVGSTVAEQLVRTGARDLVLVDPDVVEPPNLSRTIYARGDVGRRKVDAAAERFRSIDPDVQVRREARPVQELATDELSALVGSSDVVIAATDDPEAQARIDAVATRAGVPAVFVGLYAGAAAGEVILTVPGVTRCYGCAAPSRHRQAGRPATDYGSGRLQGEPALGCDIHRVSSIATRLALGLLMVQQGADTELTRQLAEVLGADEQFLLTSTVPDWDLFETILADVPGQHGFASAWLQVRGRPECPVCGDEPLDLDQLLTRPDRSAMADLLAETEPTVPDDAITSTDAGDAGIDLSGTDTLHRL